MTVPRASVWWKPGPIYRVRLSWADHTIEFDAIGKTHAIDIVAAINREEPKDEYGIPIPPDESNPARTAGDR